MSKVPDKVRLQRLYKAIVALEKEMRGRDSESVSYARQDLRQAATKLLCAIDDLREESAE